MNFCKDCTNAIRPKIFFRNETLFWRCRYSTDEITGRPESCATRRAKRDVRDGVCPDFHKREC